MGEAAVMLLPAAFEMNRPRVLPLVRTAEHHICGRSEVGLLIFVISQAGEHVFRLQGQTGEKTAYKLQPTAKGQPEPVQVLL